jgi:hypothetical protein
VDTAKAGAQRDHLLGAINDALARGMISRASLQERFRTEGLADTLDQIKAEKAEPSVIEAGQ